MYLRRGSAGWLLHKSRSVLRLTSRRRSAQVRSGEAHVRECGCIASAGLAPIGRHNLRLLGMATSSACPVPPDEHLGIGHRRLSGVVPPPVQSLKLFKPLVRYQRRTDVRVIPRFPFPVCAAERKGGILPIVSRQSRLHSDIDRQRAPAPPGTLTSSRYSLLSRLAPAARPRIPRSANSSSQRPILVS